MGEKAWTEPSPSDWERWEARLLEGEEPSSAAKAERQTCSSFRRQNADRHGEAIQMSREARAHYADERAEAWSQEPDADDRMRERWLRRWQPAYAQGARLEVVGDGGGPIQLEGRAVVGLADVVQLARELGVGHLVGLDAGDPGRELAAPRDVLPDPA